MTKKQIEKMARRIASDYSRTPFDQMTMVLKTLFIFVASWHIKNTTKKKKAKHIDHPHFCGQWVDCNKINCGTCERIFNTTVKFIKEQE
jgi:hypothetical protein